MNVNLWYSGEFVLVTQRCSTSFKDVLMAKKRNGIVAMIATHGENCTQIKLRQDRKYIERLDQQILCFKKPRYLYHNLL